MRVQRVPRELCSKQSAKALGLVTWLLSGLGIAARAFQAPSMAPSSLKLTSNTSNLCEGQGGHTQRFRRPDSNEPQNDQQDACHVGCTQLVRQEMQIK